MANIDAISRRSATVTTHTSYLGAAPRGEHSLDASTSASGIPSIARAETLSLHDRVLAWVGSTRIGTGIVRDIRRRAPYYVSDWTDAWNYRVVPAIVLIFCANVLPGIAFSLQAIETTQQYGVTEVLLSSFMAAFVFSVFGAQPLCILGVTGPITILNTTIFNIIERQPNPPNYLEFIGWVYLWGAILHWITAALNWCNFLRYVTLFFCDTFGFFTSWVYLQYGVQVITTQFRTASDTEAFVGIILALIMLVTCYLFRIASHSTLFHRHVRRFLADYGIPICLVACSAVAYWGRFNAANPATLPVAKAFEPAGGREWLVKFWRLEAKWVGIAFPFGIALWVLFFFDHNVSSLMAQGSQFPLRKPPGFHHDFFLLGITTLIAGLLGIPAPNGLLPQAPIHTYSLLVMGAPQKKDIESSIEGRPSKESEGEKKTPLAPVRSRLSGVHMPQFQHEPEPDPHFAQDTEGLTVAHEVPVAVVEQRVSNLAQGALCLVLLTGPFLHILNLIPRGVLAGLFWYMGADTMQDNRITHRILYLLKDKNLTPVDEPLRRVRKSRLLLFLTLQLAGAGTAVGITDTVAAIGFPVIVLMLIPLRTFVIPQLPFTTEELTILDGPTASAFTLESVGGGVISKES